jgi:hypothetical protein
MVILAPPRALMSARHGMTGRMLAMEITALSTPLPPMNKQHLEHVRRHHSTSCLSRRHGFGGRQVRVFSGSNCVSPGACMRGARGATARARGTSTTPPSAAGSTRRPQALVSLQASIADPEAWHRSGTTARSGITRWSHTEGGSCSQSGEDGQNPRLYRFENRSLWTYARSISPL